MIPQAVPEVAEVRYSRPPLAPYQLGAFFTDHRAAFVEASTKSGKTHGGLAWLFERAALADRYPHHWWVAPVYPQARVAWERLARAVPSGLREANETQLNIRLANGSVVWFKSGEKPDNLYGEDVGAAVLDEASRMREQAYHAVRSTLTKTRGPLRVIGNVKGRKNWFWRLCRRAESGERGWLHRRITAHDAVKAGILDQAEIEEAKRALPAYVFQELYMAEASDEAANPFSLSAVRQRIAPLSAGPAAAFGVDLAKSVDYTVVVGLDEQGRACHLERFQAPWTETIARIRRAVGSTRAFVDSTGVGDPVLESLQRGAPGRFEGYKFTSESKQRLMEGLAVAIQQGRVSYPDGVVVQELEAFEFTYTRTGVRYSAPEGLHDDAVCALALAVACKDAKRATWRPVEI